MPPHPSPAATSGYRERLPTVPADLREDHYHLVHLLDRQQRTEGSAVAGLAAALASGGRRPALLGALGWIRRGGTRGIGRVLAQPGFQLAAALPLGQDQRLGGARRRCPDLQRQG